MARGEERVEAFGVTVKRAVIFRISLETGKWSELEIPLFCIGGVDPLTLLEKSTMVGDLVLVDGKLYRRVWGGFVEATEDDEAAFAAAKL